MTDEPERRAADWWGDVLRYYTSNPPKGPRLKSQAVSVPIAALIALREALVDVLCSQALADHLGDVRDAELTLWKLLGVVQGDYFDRVSPYDSAKALLQKNGYPLPDYLEDGR